jgi:hypothetical protein
MKHFIYKTTHVNGKYYVGRHSTDNLDDGYIGSGNWPLSIKDKSTLTREILEFADNADDLKILEGQYLTEHYGKIGCMNATSDPIGFDSDNNPMKNPDVASKISGDNHWSRREPERYRELFSGDAHWMNQDPIAKQKFLDDHPNKDGRNAKLAMERGTHVNLTDNNPAKQWSRDGTHPMLRRGDGSSIGNDANRKRIADGTHNLLGADENNRRIDNDTHNFLGSSANEAMLAAGKHPSQQKATCECCGWTVSIGMFKRWHDEGKCHMNPDSPRYNPKLKQR